MTPETLLYNDTFNDVWVNNSNDVYAVGEDLAIMHFDGNTWHEDHRGPPVAQLTGVWGSSSTDVYAVGGSKITRAGYAGPVSIGRSLILHYDGRDWRSVALNADVQRLYGIWGRSSADIYFASSGIFCGFRS